MKLLINYNKNFGNGILVLFKLHPEQTFKKWIALKEIYK